jgi:trigger factor
MSDEPRPDQPGTDTGATATETPTPPPTEEAPAGEEKKEKKEPEKLTQTVDIRDVGPCRKHIKVTIDRGAIDRRMDEKFDELVPDANVAGFRPGKAPRRYVVRRYQKEVADQVKGEVLLASMEQLAEDHDIAPLSRPDFDPFQVELPKDGPLVYEFEVEVRPEFALPDYKGLRIRRPVQTFTDDDVAQEERRVLSQYGQIVPKPEGNAQIGDVIVADGHTRLGERSLGSFKEMTVRVEKQLAFKDGIAEHFADQVQGANAGETRVVDVTMSQSVADASLRGQSVKTTFEIKDVKTLRLPELTPEFLENFGVQTADAFRELIRVVLQRRLEYLQRQSARQQVMQHIAATANWDLPQDLLQRQARRAMSRRIMEMRADGISEDEIRGRLRILQQDVLRSTEVALKEHFVLQKIAEVEKIDIDESDIDDEIERMAQQEGESARRIRARLEKEDMMEALAAEIIERKSLDLILNSAQYEDYPLRKEDTAPVATVEQQAVHGAMPDPLAPPPGDVEPPPGTPQS